MRKNKNKKVIIKDQSLIDKKKNKSLVVKIENLTAPKKRKVVEWNYKTNQIVYIKNGFANSFSSKNTDVNFRNAISSIHIIDEYVLIVADKKFKGISIEENYFFILYRGSIYTMSGKHFKEA